MKSILRTIYYNFGDGHYNLNILFETDKVLILFNSVKFIYLPLDEIYKYRKWNRLQYDILELESVYITDIREDELVSYFITFSNDDIMYIYQIFNGIGEWSQNFKIVSPNMSDYKEIVEYKNEDWVEIMKVID